MCERPPFRRWLPQALIERIREVPEVVMIFCSATKKGLLSTIRSPPLEIIIGLICIASSLSLSLTLLTVTFTTRAIIALCIIPSVIILMHGEYRLEGDC